MNFSANPSIKKAYHPETLTVLAVEDHSLFSKEIKHALMRHNVVFAKSLEEGRERYNECLPNITFLDIDLPDGNGFALLDYIVSQEPDAYVAMLTGSKVEEDVAISRKKGARGYIIKPFTQSKIEQCVTNYLEYREHLINNLLSEVKKHRQQDILVLSSDMIIPDTDTNPV